MKRVFAYILVIGATTLLCGPAQRAQQTPHHEFVVTARRYAFEPAVLNVHQGDLVRVTLQAEDIPHSLVIDALRISKKASPGQNATFELFVDRAGEFPFYCNLAQEDGCRNMKGRLIVRPESEQPASSAVARSVRKNARTP